MAGFNQYHWSLFLALWFYGQWSVAGLQKMPVQRGSEGWGHILHLDGRESHVNSDRCQVAVLGELEKKRTRVYREFSQAGGEGEVINLSTLVPTVVPDQYGHYLEMSKVPPFVENSSSSFLWLRDRYSYLFVREWVSSGQPVFLRPSGDYTAAILPSNHPLSLGMLLHRLDERYHAVPILVVTENTNEYVIEHERQHQYDLLGQNGFDYPSLFFRLHQFLLQPDVLGAGIRGDHEMIFLRLVLEQRAEAHCLDVMKSHLEGGRREIAVRKRRTKTLVSMMPYGEYYRQRVQADRSQVLGASEGIYGKPVQNLLKLLKQRAPKRALELRQILVDYLLPSHELGPDVLFGD